ncbi:MAG: D-glycero-beta-D-manno-heptose 1-phosphate adenylyltransferase [Cryomorphaceae bacterium]
MSVSLEHRIFSHRSAISDVLEAWRAKGERIVFTNGVFDLLHPGHIVYLEQAAALGTKLVLGLNSDASAKKLGKGEHRPINDQRSRSLVVAGLRSVDMVVLFDEATPLELIKTVLPAVLVKGGDYKIETVVGAEEVVNYGGEVKLLRFLDGYSTTAIEQKILKGVSK